MKTLKLILYILVGSAIIAILLYGHTILPMMGDDEYFIDKNGDIHSKNCPYMGAPWFTSKYSKYDFKKTKNTSFCRDCFFFDEEIEKLMNIHRYNIEMEMKRLLKNGASDDYIDNRIRQYEW